MSCVKKNVQQVAYLLTQDSDYRLGSHVGIQNGVHEFYQRYQMTQFLTFTYQIPSFTDSRATYRFGKKNAVQCSVMTAILEFMMAAMRLVRHFRSIQS